MKDVLEICKELLNRRDYTLEETGMSGAEVRIFTDSVLKIGKQSAETDNAHAMTAWLKGRLPVMDMPVYITLDGTAYTLMEKAEGKILCTEDLLRNHPMEVIHLMAEGLRKMWAVNIHDCPCTLSRLEERLKRAEEKIRQGLVSMENAEEGTYGPDGFANPEELLAWLKEHKPEEDLVLTHGDYCLPNVFVQDQEITAFIDLGKAGPADRWQDIALCIRSLEHNFDGRYFDGIPLFAFKKEYLLEELGIPFDEAKYRYYILLDELS